MECNKDEAIRARDIAERKMQTNDFVGARKFAYKAYQLYPDLDNISQMLMVCDVHYRAEQKLFGNEMDWYGILQVEQVADDVVIKKQYRKFALSLHPDKNKFCGAEAAFKLIGEAQRVLLDREKRTLYDLKRKVSGNKVGAPYRPPHKASCNSNVAARNINKSNFSGLNPLNQQPLHPVQPGKSEDQSTFWTVCPHCSVRYQYYKVNVVNKYIHCQSCKAPFIAYDMHVQGVKLTTDFSRSTINQQNNGAHNVNVRGQSSFNVENSKGQSLKNASKKGSAAAAAAGFEKMNRKRERKQVVESESSASENSSESEEDTMVDEHGDVLVGHTSGSSRDQHRRRSSRHKQHVSYKENLSDDDGMPSSKRAKGNGSFFANKVENADAPKQEASTINHSDVFAVKHQKEVKQKGSAEEGLPNGSQTTKKESQKKSAAMGNSEKSSVASNYKVSNTEEPSFTKLLHYPDPDFNTFEKQPFLVGQIWALYDEIDAMPRSYARIKKVFSSGFKVHMTWLEPNPDDENGKKWLHEKFPFSCGKFKHDRSETVDNIHLFSHLMLWEKGSVRDTFKMYPRSGETWALFKNWDMKWCGDPDFRHSHRYDCEIVEILSNYADDVGILVAFLGKVDGFVSIFSIMVKEGNNTYQVQPDDLLRFSHRIPSFKLNGDEGDGVPAGSFELDPAALPANLSNSKSADSSMWQNGEKKRDHHDAPGNIDKDFSDSPDSTLENIEVPDPQFHDFDTDKSLENFQVGQIWALYSDEDGLPKYYGQVKKIDSHSDFQLHIVWLSSSSLPNDVISWSDESMLISCGKFKVTRDLQSYDSITAFSHLVKAAPGKRKNEIFIFPSEGEIWALYRNWNADIKCSDLENCEYDIVKVLKDNGSQTEVLVLERVDGYNSVFKAQVRGGLTISMNIPQAELLRFSHQIPAFELTDENGGSLRGFFELDSAAFPIRFFQRS